MKKKIFSGISLLLFFGVFLTSCTKKFTNINTDPNGTPNALPNQLLAPALVSVVSYNMTRNRSFNNELMQVTVNQSDADATVFRYSFPNTYSDYLYNGWFTELTNFKDIYQIASKDVNYNRSYMGISLICQSWIYSLLTDTYGDVPFTESNEARDSVNFAPKFDPQKDIYTGIFKNLETADTLLKTGTAINPSSDPVYNGDVTKWRKFGNSLYLRLLLRLSGKAEVADSCIAKIKQIVADPVNYPIMTSNADAAILRWTGEGYLVSPYVATRAQDFRSPAICSFFIDHLVNWSDPRINAPQYGSNGVNRWGIATSGGRYFGIASGYAPGTGDNKGSYFYATDQTVNGSTPPAITMQTEPMTGMIMNYAELQFILCECAAKGWITTKTAEAYYESGIQNSITQWLPNWTESVTDYINEADIQWDDNASLNDKMEKIMLQKYYAMLFTDLQQWFEYRRTGHPILPKGNGLQNGGIMPARLKYPIYLQGTNPVNYREAVNDQGPDEIFTNVWWQKP